MPGRSVTAKPCGPMPLLVGLSLVLLSFDPVSLAMAEEASRSLTPVSSLPPLAVTPGAGVRDRAVRRTAGDVAEEPAPEEIPALPETIVSRPSETPSFRADAGDDQIGLVGRRMTLNGSRSHPDGGLGYRWIQVSGPQADSLVEDDHFLRFTPKSSGIYRFVLVVASGSRISEPDTVEVIVGALAPTNASTSPPRVAPTLLVSSTEELARTALASIAGGAEASEFLAETFDAMASRMELYQTYADVFLEVSRRLEGILSTDPAQRNVWAQMLFLPLSARLVEHMRVVGLDLSRSEGARQPLNSAQKARLVEQFRAIATGFRETRPAL